MMRNMKKICISKDWDFYCPELDGQHQVDLPHDYSIQLPRNAHALGGAANGFFQGTSGRYTKYIQFDDSKHVILDVDGAYMCARISLNDNLLGMHPYGYTPILMDLSSKLRINSINKLDITTQNLQPSTRWYSGAGIYRDVYLWTGGSIRIEPRDVFINTTKIEKEKATVSVMLDVSSDNESDIVLQVQICSADRNVVATKDCGIHVEEGKNTKEFLFEIENPMLWNDEHPYLYEMVAEIRKNNIVEDVAKMKFGIRTIVANAKDGLLINGQSVKLRGGCIHHDHGGLGAASFPVAERRKLTLLKQAGYNAVRISHNPPSLALLEACDELGLYVMDEAFDMWNVPKNSYDYSLWFPYCWQNDIKAMVLRDRNHPCVISYSIGNEIAERNGLSDGVYWSRKLADEIRKYDATKLVAAGVCEVWSELEPNAPEEYKKTYLKELGVSTAEEIALNFDKITEQYMEPLDIVGYNYLYERYEKDHKNYPERIMWGSETHALNFYHSWSSVMRNSYVIGDFTWTAYDNLGEAGCGRSVWERDGEIKGISMAEYPWRQCYQGDFDLCGYRRPQSYFRESIWVGNCEPRIFTTHPEHFGEKHTGTGWHWHDVHETWTFEDKYLGRPVKVEVYTDAEEIRFLLNGQHVGVAVPKDGVAALTIPYEKGALTAISYRNNEEIKRYTLQTVGAPYKVQAVAEQEVLKADHRDLCYIGIAITDKEGHVVTEATNEVNCRVEGGELLSIFSGNPANEDEYCSGKCHVFEGRAVAVVRTKQPGTVKVFIESRELTTSEVVVNAVI